MTIYVSHETQTNYKIYNLFGINKEYIITICHNIINNAKYNQYINQFDEYRPYMRHRPYTRISHIGQILSHIVRHVHMTHIVHILRHNISNIWVPSLKIKLNNIFLLSHINISNRNRK